MAPLSSRCLCLAAVPGGWWPCSVLPTLCLSPEPPLGFMALAGVALLECYCSPPSGPLGTPWPGSVLGHPGVLLLWWPWLNPPTGASCPVLSSLCCHQPSDFTANAVLLRGFFSGAVTRRQGWWVLPSLPRLSGGWWNGISGLRGPVPFQSVYFPDPFPHSLWWQMLGLSPSVQRLRVAGGSILYSLCSFPAAELSKKLSKNTSHN